MHVFVPGTWTVHDGHGLLERIEADVHAVVPNCVIDTHLESLDDPTSWHDVGLDRKDSCGGRHLPPRHLGHPR